jgi:hypothetical protein
MSLKKVILQLQKEQEIHDRIYHKDIITLSTHNRIKHLVFHLCKYTARFMSDDRDNFKNGLIDAFNIILSLANTLNCNLDTHYTDYDPLFQDCAKLVLSETDLKINNDYGFLKLYVGNTAKLAKVCESLDHIEYMNFREIMEQSVINLFEEVALKLVSMNFDIIVEVKARLKHFESKHPLKEILFLADYQ